MVKLTNCLIRVDVTRFFFNLYMRLLIVTIYKVDAVHVRRYTS